MKIKRPQKVDKEVFEYTQMIVGQYHFTYEGATELDRFILSNGGMVNKNIHKIRKKCFEIIERKEKDENYIQTKR